MEENRIDKIKKIWHGIHGEWVPMFHWSHYKSLEYKYNDMTDSIECECGVSVPIDILTENLTEDIIRDKIYELDGKVQDYYWENFKIIMDYD